KMTVKALTPNPTAMVWDFESCAIARSASVAYAKCAPAPLKAQSSIVVCRWKRSFLFLRSHECNNTNREKIARGRGGGPPFAMRRAQAVNQQSAGPRLCRGRGRHFGRQTAR